MPSQVVSPALNSDDATVGSTAWTCANGDTEADDGVESSASLAAGNQSHYLLCLAGGLSIPAGATIDGIEVTAWRRVANAGGGTYPTIVDASVRLTYGGSFFGADRSAGATWSTTEASGTYGGPTDTWGVTPTVAELNHSSFGVAISASGSGGVSPTTAYIDWVTITVYYTETDPSPAGDGEFAHYDEAGDGVWWSPEVVGIVDDDLNAPPSADAVTLVAPSYDQHEDFELLDWISPVLDTSSGAVLGGLDDCLALAWSEQHDEPEDADRDGVSFVGAAWLADGSICDCAGVATIRGGYGTAIVRGFGAAAAESQAFGTAIVRGGYGTAKIIISCQC